MFKNLSTKNKVLLFISISLSLFISLLVAKVYYAEKKDFIKEEKLLKKETISAYKNTIYNYDILYKSKLESILNSPEVKEAIEKQDRSKLYSLVKTKWEELQNENKNLRILHFHQPDGLTLLRAHQPENYDDNISKRREMPAHMHKHKKAITSFEAGINLLGYRVMVPIFYKDNYIGAIEIGTKPDFILQEMKNVHNVSGAIFAKEAEIYDKGHIDKSKKIIANFRLDSDNLEDRDLINYLPKDYTLNSNTRVEKDERIYDIYLLEHIDFRGDVSAKTLIFNDITQISEDFNSEILQIIIFSILLYLIVIGAMKYGLEKMLNKIDATNIELEKNIAFLKSHQLAMDASSIVSKADLHGNIIYVNDNFCKVSGYTKKEAIGKPHSLLRHKSTKKETFVNMWETIKGKKVWKGVLQNRGKSSDYSVDMAILPILDENDDIVEYIAVRHDITKMVLQQKALDSAANTDTLTGLGNRYKLNNDIKNSISPALAIVNIDSFSQINDFYGHEKGDTVIRNLGVLLDQLKNGKEYSIYHLQGDEYVIFNKDVDKQMFIDKITQITSQVSTVAIMLDNEEIYLDLSTAISFENKKKILSTADMALKIAKQEKKNIVIYSDSISLNDQYQNNIKWAKKIKDGLKYDKFVPVFQPIVNNHTKKWEKYEALVRLEDDGKLVSPYFFLDISKKTKHYKDITKIMIKKSFDMFKNRDEEFSINLTMEDIINEDIKTYIFDMLDSYQIGDRVVFEIVESESIENFELVAIFIDKVKSYGSKIAIDDFGTGYSNFKYLMKVKADYIKIDGSMIKNIDTDKDAQMVVETIVEFAKKMNMKTVAEFVENQSILDKVNELGIDYTQGYFYSEPKKVI
ncbi:MAG: EAL domain-containing protein [Campylobacterota bacterium]|nr:EAL domain-containing protein [Campylobacterota bacterium]